MAFCMNCGKQLPEGAKYCSSCGTALETKNTSTRESYAGKVLKCPSCGEVIPSFTGNCPTCGHELRNSEISSSIKELSLKLESTYSNLEKISLIRTFPIQNTKEDILEFMILASTNIENSSQQDVAEAWSVKFEQAYEKSKIFNNVDKYLFNKLQTA